MTEVSAQVRGKEVRQIDRVVIRFAGDSGDGMQLTGERFTSETASFGNDLSTLPDFPAEIRAPAGSPAGVSGFQLHFSDHDILTPGDAPNVLVAMNPAALRSNIKDLPARQRSRGQHRRLHPRQPEEGRLRRQPARGRLARRVPGPPGAADLAHHRGRRRGRRGQQEGGRAGEEHVRARPDELAVPPADRRHRGVAEGQVRQASRDRRRQHPGVQGRPRLRRDHRVVLGHVRGRAGQDGAGHLPQHQRKHGAFVRADRGLAADRAAAVPRLLPDHPGLRHPSRAVASTSSSASAPSRPRTRSPASAPRSARRSAGRSASPPHPVRASA